MSIFARRASYCWAFAGYTIESSVSFVVGHFPDFFSKIVGIWTQVFQMVWHFPINSSVKLKFQVKKNVSDKIPQYPIALWDEPAGHKFGVASSFTCRVETNLSEFVSSSRQNHFECYLL